MTKFIRPTCACGCGRERRPRSMYASDSCNNTAYRKRLRDGTATKMKPRPCGRAQFNCGPARHRPVKVVDPLLSLPYYITVAEHNEHMERHEYLAGMQVFIGEQLVLI